MPRRWRPLARKRPQPPAASRALSLRPAGRDVDCSAQLSPRSGATGLHPVPGTLSLTLNLVFPSPLTKWLLFLSSHLQGTTMGTVAVRGWSDRLTPPLYSCLLKPPTYPRPFAGRACLSPPTRLALTAGHGGVSWDPATVKQGQLGFGFGLGWLVAFVCGICACFIIVFLLQCSKGKLSIFKRTCYSHPQRHEFQSCTRFLPLLFPSPC